MVPHHVTIPDLFGGRGTSAPLPLCTVGAVPGPELPSDLDGCHALAIPAGEDIRALAAAWFADSGWEVFPLAPEPVSGDARDRARGAVPMAQSRPGRLRLAGQHALVGPVRLHAREARALGLPERELDLFGLPASVTDPVALGWLTAAARRTAGAVLSADRSQVIVPDPATAVDLTLWTGTRLTASELVTVVRPFLAGARVEQAQALAGAGDGAFSVAARFEFDGALTVFAQPRDAVPVAVAAVQWGAHGPWTYHVAWVPPDPAELTAEQPSRLHLIARSRVAPVLARVVRALLLSAGGVVVDDGGFPVTPDDLTRRAATL